MISVWKSNLLLVTQIMLWFHSGLQLPNHYYHQINDLLSSSQFNAEEWITALHFITWFSPSSPLSLSIWRHLAILNLKKWKYFLKWCHGIGMVWCIQNSSQKKWQLHIAIFTPSNLHILIFSSWTDWPFVLHLECVWHLAEHAVNSVDPTLSTLIFFN